MTEEMATTLFHDHAEDQEGVLVVRKWEDKVGVCLSLRNDGDFEAFFDRDVAQKLIAALQDAISQVVPCPQERWACSTFRCEILHAHSSRGHGTGRNERTGGGRKN